MEEAQSNALNMLMMKKNPGGAVTQGKSRPRDSWNIDDDWVVTDSGMLITVAAFCQLFD